MITISYISTNGYGRMTDTEEFKVEDFIRTVKIEGNPQCIIL